MVSKRCFAGTSERLTFVYGPVNSGFRAGRLVRILWLAGLMASGAQSGAYTQSAGEPTALPASPPVAVAPAGIWKSGIGSGFRPGNRQTGFSLGVGFGVRGLGSKQ